MSKIVLVGGSAGAVSALQVILRSLPADFPAAILVVLHSGPEKSVVPHILNGCSALHVRHAVDGEPIIAGRVLIAPPDEHLTVVMKDGKACARLIHGPKENHCRPAIDTLFRSAASSVRDNAIGVVLSGHLDDGTVGLQAIKAGGGLAIVQDPIEAEIMDMPASALEHADIDRVLRAAEIGPALVKLAASHARPAGTLPRSLASSLPEWIDIENRIVGRASDMEDIEKIGKPSSMTCPECAGALWEVTTNAPVRYRCHTGHSYTARVLQMLQHDVVENAIWAAVRALHEQERLFIRLGETERGADRAVQAADYEARAARARAHSKTLREVISLCSLTGKGEDA